MLVDIRRGSQAIIWISFSSLGTSTMAIIGALFEKKKKDKMCFY